MISNYEKRGYLLDDFRLFHLNALPDSKIEYHYHEFHKLLFLRSGAGGYTAEGKRYALESGDIVLIGSHCVHRPEFDERYERIILYISPAYLRQASVPGCDLEQIFGGIAGHVLRPDKKEREKLFSLTEQMEQEMSGSRYGREILTASLLLRLLVELGRVLQEQKNRLPDAINPESSRVLDMLQYLDTHLTEDITIDDLAQRFYISKYHMMRLFRRETGISIHAYLSNRRLLLARDLMAQGVSATESCFRAGFKSYSAFCRAYGKRFGTTPTGRSCQLAEGYE